MIDSGSPETGLLEAIEPIAGHPFACLIDARDGRLVAGGFCAAEELFERLAPEERAERSPAPAGHPVRRALRAYAAGRLEALEALPVRQPATPFHAEVQRALRRIPAGRTRSYAELARAAGRPAAVRAAASGCARNRVALVVPCHRVLRGDGSLGGYAYGLEVKRALLAHEAAAVRPPSG